MGLMSGIIDFSTENLKMFAKGLQCGFSKFRVRNYGVTFYKMSVAATSD